MEFTKSDIAPSFLDLPLEIRIMVYDKYLEHQIQIPAKIIHEEPLSTLRLHWKPTLLAVNKQINDEISDLFRRQTTSTYRISWQESGFDGPSICSFRARGRKPEEGMEHLQVEIYPPHRHRPIDIVHIWRGVEELRSALEYCWRPGRLSIICMENAFANWSHEDFLRDKLDLLPPAGKDGFVDLCYLLDTFQTLTSLSNVTIRLPTSVRDIHDIQEWQTALEAGMMAPPEPEHDLMETIEDNQSLTKQVGELETLLKCATGRRSRAIIEDICDHGLRKISPQELHRLKQVWPHSDCISEYDDCPDGRYTGVAQTDPLPDPPSSPSFWTASAAKARVQKKALSRLTQCCDWYVSPEARHQVLSILQDMEGSQYLA